MLKPKLIPDFAALARTEPTLITGMAGCGKTTLVRRLVEVGVPAIDLDTFGDVRDERWIIPAITCDVFLGNGVFAAGVCENLAELAAGRNVILVRRPKRQLIAVWEQRAAAGVPLFYPSTDWEKFYDDLSRDMAEALAHCSSVRYYDNVSG